MLQADARTIRVRIPLPNPGGRVKPGMYATVRLTSPMVTTLTLPASAIVQTGDRSYVFVDEGGGRLMPHDVRLGRKGGDYIEVLSGVSAGQRVVTSAQFLLDSESNLSEVMRSMIQQGTSGTADKGADMKGMNVPSATRR
jgi:Cu(I)/Ag(I) efflux system membrane fusion protein